MRTSGFHALALAQITRASGSVAVMAVVPTMSGLNSAIFFAMSSCETNMDIAS